MRYLCDHLPLFCYDFDSCDLPPGHCRSPHDRASDDPAPCYKKEPEAKRTTRTQKETVRDNASVHVAQAPYGRGPHAACTTCAQDARDFSSCPLSPAAREWSWNPESVVVAGMLLHAARSLSSLVFRTPGTSAPHVIDSLYRAQVVAFTMRSVLVVLLVVWLQDLQMLELFLRDAAVVACHKAADSAAQKARPLVHSASVTTGEGAGAKDHATAPRDGVRRALRPYESSRPLVEAGRSFYSLARCNATSKMLFVTSSDYVVVGAFYTMVVIQVTAFLMTLRKNGFVPPYMWKVLYTAMHASGGWGSDVPQRELLRVASHMYCQFGLCSCQTIFYHLKIYSYDAHLMCPFSVSHN